MLIVLMIAMIVVDLQADASAIMVVMVVLTPIFVVAVVHVVVNYWVHCVVPFVVAPDFANMPIEEPGVTFEAQGIVQESNTKRSRSAEAGGRIP